MKDILDVYELPYNPNIPLVCMDEKPYQLPGDARQCLPMRPGNNQKIDSEYVRNGTCNKRYTPDEARRIIKRLEIHYTPKHGSWLNIAEIELNVMSRQCLARRIESISTLREELSARETERNTLTATVNRQFRTTDAKVKLSSLYPKLTTEDE